MKAGRISRTLFPPPSYAHSVRIDNPSIVYTAGGVPLDGDGVLIGAGDFAVQTRQVVANLVTVLGEEGLTAANVIKSTVYVVSDESEDLATVWSVVVAQGLADDAIAATLVGVSVLGYVGQLVEIELVAACSATGHS